MIWKRVKDSIVRFMRNLQYRIDDVTFRLRAWFGDRIDDFRRILGFRD